MGSPFDNADFTSLKLFLAIVDRGSIAEAARQTFISPTAVTKRMQDLEQAHGVQLFVRSSKGVVATDAGRALARQVRTMESLLEHIRTEMKAHADGASGHVRLISNASARIAFLAGEIAAFAVRFPGIRVDIEEARSEDVVCSVQDGHADFGVFAPPVALSPGVMASPIRDEVLALAVDAKHPLANVESVGSAELRGLPFLSVHNASSLALLVTQALGPTPSRRVATNEVARWLVSRRLGVMILPEAMISPYESALGIRAVRIHEPWARRPLHLCLRADGFISPAARTFLDVLRGRSSDSGS
jgi:DNA-binding transcriptional LysR family regulator